MKCVNIYLLHIRYLLLIGELRIVIEKVLVIIKLLCSYETKRLILTKKHLYEIMFFAGLIYGSGSNRSLCSFYFQMVSSDADEELLFNIPFTGNIKLKGLIIMGGSHGHHPSKVKLFKNRPHMTFDDAQSKSDQVCSFYL